MNLNRKLVNLELRASSYGVIKPEYYLHWYNGNNFRIVILKGQREKGFEFFDEFGPLDISDSDGFITDEFRSSESLRCSLSRSKRAIREYVLCNDFTYFVTLTINSKNADRFSLTDSQFKLRSLLKKAKRLNKDFKYLLITERHTNGAFHFHGFFKGVRSSDITLIKKSDFSKLPRYILDCIDKGEKVYYYNLFQDSLGWCTLSKIKNLARASSYCLKYVTKDCVRNENGYIYICSKGLSSPSSSHIQPLSLLNVPSYKIESDYCITYDVDFSELSRDQKLYFIQSIEDVSLKQSLLRFFNFN